MSAVSAACRGDEPPAGLSMVSLCVFVFTLVGYPLIAPLSIVLGIDNRIISLPFRAVLLGFSVIAILIGSVLRRRWRLDLFWLLFAAFWILYLARIAIDASLNPQALRLSVAEYFSFAVGTSLVPSVAVALGLGSGSAGKGLSFVAILGGAGILANIAVLAFTTAGTESILALSASRQGTETLNPIALGHLGVTVIITSCLKLIFRARPSWVETATLYALIGIGLAASLFGASRGPVLALVAVVPLLGYMAFRNASRQNGIRIAVLCVGGLAALASLAVMLQEITLWVRIQSLLAGADSSLGIRVDLLFRAAAEFARRPILGAGIEPLGFYPHNLLLESFLVFGIISGVLFLAVMLMTTMHALRLVADRPDMAWIALLFLQYAIAGMFSGALYSSYSLWVLVAAVGASRACVGPSNSLLCIAPRDPALSGAGS